MATLISRRSFLRRSAATLGAAAAAPIIVPAWALGREGATAPSERITMGFIGLGGQGTGHLLGGAWTYVAGGYTARPDVQVQAVFDVAFGPEIPGGTVAWKSLPRANHANLAARFPRQINCAAYSSRRRTARRRG